MKKYMNFDNNFSLEKIINNEKEFNFILNCNGKKFLLDFSESSVIYLKVKNTDLVSDYGIYFTDDKSLLKKLEEDSKNILSLTNYKQMVVRVNNRICDIVLINPPVFKES